MPATKTPKNSGDKEEKGKFANSSKSSVNTEEPKKEVDKEIRTQIMAKVGTGFNRVDIHPIIGDTKFRVNCWKSENANENQPMQWRIEKSLWVVFEDGKLVA